MSPFVDGERVRKSVDDRVVTPSRRIDDRSAMIDAVEIAYDAMAYRVQNHLRKGEGDDRPRAEIEDHEHGKRL